MKSLLVIYGKGTWLRWLSNAIKLMMPTIRKRAMPPISIHKNTDHPHSPAVIFCLVNGLQRINAFFSCFAVSIIRYYRPLGCNSQ